MGKKEYSAGMVKLSFWFSEFRKVIELLNSGEFSARFHKLFQEIYEKTKSCNNVATLQNIKVEADALKVRLLNEIAKKDEQIAIAKARAVAEQSNDSAHANTDPITPTQPKIKKQKNISIKTINLANS